MLRPNRFVNRPGHGNDSKSRARLRDVVAEERFEETLPQCGVRAEDQSSWWEKRGEVLLEVPRAVSRGSRGIRDPYLRAVGLISASGFSVTIRLTWWGENRMES